MEEPSASRVSTEGSGMPRTSTDTPSSSGQWRYPSLLEPRRQRERRASGPEEASSDEGHVWKPVSNSLSPERGHPPAGATLGESAWADRSFAASRTKPSVAKRAAAPALGRKVFLKVRIEHLQEPKHSSQACSREPDRSIPCACPAAARPAQRICNGAG